jgi:hypothetical protein
MNIMTLRAILKQKVDHLLSHSFEVKQLQSACWLVMSRSELKRNKDPFQSDQNSHKSNPSFA